MELDIEHLRSWIGRTEVRQELVASSLVERFNATFDRVVDVANGDVAPLLIHLCLAPPVAPTAQLGPDGHPARGGFLPPVSLPRRMWAGGAFTFHDDIRVGELVTRTSTINDVVVKEGRTGTLCFVTVGHEFHSNDRHVITERHDIVYRSDETEGSARKPREAAPGGDHQRVVTPSPALLFRYSALTFNGHRIHYDSRYAREVEGYPGLIVHGPLQATMLVQLAAELRGRPPKQFDFRSLSPIFGDADFTLNATDYGEALELWTSYLAGPTAMEARAIW